MEFILGDWNVAQFDPSHLEALPLVGIHSSIQMDTLGTANGNE